MNSGRMQLISALSALRVIYIYNFIQRKDGVSSVLIAISEYYFI